jgi:hypothetical protein
MGVILAVAFVMVCLAGAMSGIVALCLVYSMFPIEQVLQALVPWFRTSSVGVLAVNGAVAISATVALGSLAIKSRIGPKRLTKSLISTSVLFAWAALSCSWSPSNNASDAVLAGLPYFVLMVFICPLLISTPGDMVAFASWSLVIGVPVALAFCFSPEFINKWGRLGLDLGGSARSNPLAIGEFGGTLVILAMLLRRPGAGLGLLRALCLTLGIVVAIKSGSRGQFFYAIIVSAIFFPIAAPVKNLRAFVFGAIGLTAILFIASIAQTILLEGFEARRFDLDELLYGESSASGRIANVLTLLEAWSRSPSAWFIGLGYHAFNSYSGSIGEPYSHVLFADAIFELGIPGILLLGTFLWYSSRAQLQLFFDQAPSSVGRIGVSVLSALYVYQLLLANKQGSLWGIPTLFMIGCIAERIAGIVKLGQAFMEESASDRPEPQG